MTSLGIAASLWSLFGAYWLVMSFGRGRAVRRQSPAARLSHLIYMSAAFILLSRDSRWSALNHRFVPQASWVELLGVVLTAAGIAFAIWARHHLGRHWSAEITIREGHQLIASGPYARIRHPIYTGMLLGILGTALVVGKYRGLLALVMVVLGFWMKARTEELFLEREFGDEYRDHKRRTGFFIPRLG